MPCERMKREQMVINAFRLKTASEVTWGRAGMRIDFREGPQASLFLKTEAVKRDKENY